MILWMVLYIDRFRYDFNSFRENQFLASESTKRCPMKRICTIVKYLEVTTKYDTLRLEDGRRTELVS